MIMMMVVKNIKITQFLSKYRVWDVYLVRIWAKTLDGSGQFPKKNSFFFFVVFPNRLIRYKTKTLANTITHANTIT